MQQSKTFDMNLKQGSELQNGKYRVESVLGQGGFGVTYRGVQVALDRPVAIKEFFMKEYCERDEATSHVTLGSQGSRELVGRFREKFVKEARLIAALKNPHVIGIHDIFEENGTAYYVMEYIGGGSLKDMVKRKGALSEAEALDYIRQIGDALSYVHERKILHLDVKPANVLIDEGNVAVLIDFGISKRYDDTGSQTSSAPVGISKGFAPIEQYKQDGVSGFAPCTDVYSLGATLYYLLTGQTPPEASDLLDEGLPPLPTDVSATTARAITMAMQPRRKDRPQTVDAFLAMLDGHSLANEESEETLIAPPTDSEETLVSLSQERPVRATNDEETVLTAPRQEFPPTPERKPQPSPKKSQSETAPKQPATHKKAVWVAAAAIIGLIGALSIGGFFSRPTNALPAKTEEVLPDDTVTYLSDYAQVRIGDFLYTDGTFSRSLGQKLCMGVVFSLKTTAEEQKHGWTHGQIVAMSNVKPSTRTDDCPGYFTWQITDVDDINSLPVHLYATDEAALGDLENGYVYTYASFTDAFPIAQAARSYGFPDDKTDGGWYIPTAGQWKEIIGQLGCATATLNPENEQWEMGEGRDIERILSHRLKDFPEGTYASSTFTESYGIRWIVSFSFQKDFQSHFGGSPAGYCFNLRLVKAF